VVYSLFLSDERQEGPPRHERRKNLVSSAYLRVLSGSI
jgi:hypothetical protein